MKEETKKWLERAEKDLETADYNFKGEKMEFRFKISRHRRRIRQKGSGGNN